VLKILTAVFDPQEVIIDPLILRAATAQKSGDPLGTWQPRPKVTQFGHLLQISEPTPRPSREGTIILLEVLSGALEIKNRLYEIL